MLTETIWQQYHSRLLGFLIRQTGNPSLAEDIVQQVFIKLIESPPQANEGPALEAWLLRVCRNMLMDYYRKNNQTFMSIEDVLDIDLPLADDVHLPDDIQDNVLLHCMENALTTLPNHHTQAIIAADLKDTPHQQLAEQLGVAPATVRSWIVRARKKLKQQLKHCQQNDCACNESTSPDNCCAVQKTTKNPA